MEERQLAGDPSEMEFECNTKLPFPTYEGNIPLAVRAAVKFNRIDQLKSETIHPRAKDLTFFPQWDNCPLDTKIPDLRHKMPKGAITLTRGKISEPLFVPKGTYMTYSWDPLSRTYIPRHKFDVGDHLGQRLPFRIGNYTALHDVHAKKYFRKRNVLLHLLNAGLITPRREVVCTLAEFNQFRKYLAGIQADMIHDKLQTIQEKKEVLREIKKSELQKEKDKIAIEKFLGDQAAKEDAMNKEIQRMFYLKQALIQEKKEWIENYKNYIKCVNYNEKDNALKSGVKGKK